MAERHFFIRTGRHDDVPAVDTLMARAFPRLLKGDYPPSVLVTAIPLIARAQPALVTCGTYYVAETTTGEIIGAGGWSLHDPANGGSGGRAGSIRHFATDPGHTRQGVAQALMQRSLLDARDAGISHMTCLSTRTAVPFYEAMGFERVDAAEVEMELRPGVRFPAIRMARRLGWG